MSESSSGTCCVCGTALAAPLYRSSSPTSLTSLCTTLDQRTVVFLCEACGHLQSPALPDIDEFYGTGYRILLDSEEEDQIYCVADGVPVFRADHQADEFLRSVTVPAGARVLDYGSAKGATIARVLRARPDIDAHVFDVSDLYAEFWERIVPAPTFATHAVPPAWAGSFDVVASFFVLEHVEDPRDVLRIMHSLLRRDGVLYAIVPNPTVNIADFVVVDHRQHFTASSLDRVLLDAGFVDVVLDSGAHEGAWVVQARAGRVDESDERAGAGHERARHAVESSVLAARGLQRYWAALGDRLRLAEQAIGMRPVAVYGAGFYGSYIGAHLEHPDRIRAYVDQNPYLQGTKHLGCPVVGPADLDPAIGDVHVGLNPRIARAAIAAVDAWRARDLTLHYL
jgi:SAM-dependent methyltransferase